MRSFVAIGLAESIVNSYNRSVFSLGDRHLDRAASVEAFVEVHALIIEDALKQTALEDITSAKQEPFSPAVFDTKYILVTSEGVGDEVTGESHTMHLCKEQVVCGSDTQLSGKLKLVSTLDNGPLE